MKDNQSGGFLTEACRDEGGSTAMEYALIASLISIVIIGTVGLIGDQVYEFFQSLVDQL